MSEPSSFSGSPSVTSSGTRPAKMWLQRDRHCQRHEACAGARGGSPGEQRRAGVIHRAADADEGPEGALVAVRVAFWVRAGAQEGASIGGSSCPVMNLLQRSIRRKRSMRSDLPFAIVEAILVDVDRQTPYQARLSVRTAERDRTAVVALGADRDRDGGPCPAARRAGRLVHGVEQPARRSQPGYDLDLRPADTAQRPGRAPLTRPLSRPSGRAKFSGSIAHVTVVLPRSATRLGKRSPCFLSALRCARP